MFKLSNVCTKLSTQPMFQILANVQELEREGHEILHFELGEPDFPTPANIKEAATRAIINDDTRYAPSTGIYDFKKVIQETTQKSRGFKPTKDQILVTPGANAIIYLALKCVLEPQDEVIVPDPGFPTYYSAIESLNGTTRQLSLDPDNNFSFTINDIEKLVNDRTRAIIINSPSNPTGQVLHEDLIKNVFHLARERDLLLISDEIYSRLYFGSDKFMSPSELDYCKSNTLILNGFSKAFSMTGWRLGVAIGPEVLINNMASLTSTIVSCVPPFIQRAGIEAICGDQHQVREMAQIYERRAKLLVKELNKIKGVTCAMPKGAIYAFANIQGTGFTSDQFCKIILDNCRIAATPGHFFGPTGEGFVRFSMVNTEDQIMLAVNRLANEFGIN
jgi:aspartate/methionine/tyrosine aminotransferase